MKDKAKEIKNIIQRLRNLHQYKNVTEEEILKKAIIAFENKKTIELTKGIWMCPCCMKKFRMVKLEQRANIEFGKE